MDTVVHFDNVTKRYGNAIAVDALDLRIEAGKFVTSSAPRGAASRRRFACSAASRPPIPAA